MTLEEFAIEIEAARALPQENAVNRLYRIEEEISRIAWAGPYCQWARDLRRTALRLVREIHPQQISFCGE